MVVLVLGAVIFGMVGTALVSSIGGSRSSASGAAADGALSRATQQLRDDVASAITPDRRDSLVRDQSAFARAVRTGSTVRSNDPARPGVLDIDDIVVAGPSSVSFRADVDATAGTECVTWRSRRVGGDMRMERLVGRSNQCGTGTLDTRTYFTADGRGSGVIDAPFSYELLCRRGTCAGSAASTSAPCRPWSRTSVTGTQRRWIVTVRADLFVLTGEAKSASGGTSVAVRSREASTYRRALGC